MKKSRRLWTDQLMDSTAEEEDLVFEKIEKTEVLAPKVQVAITETKVKTPGVVEQPKTDVTAFQTAPVTVSQKIVKKYCNFKNFIIFYLQNFSIFRALGKR